MPQFGPIKRAKLIEAFRKLGFSGPYPGGKHLYMARGTLRVRIPNPHHGDISADLLTRILREAGVSREEWERFDRSAFLPHRITVVDRSVPQVADQGEADFQPRLQHATVLGSSAAP